MADDQLGHLQSEVGATGGYHRLIGLRTAPDPDAPAQEEVILTLGASHLRTLGIAHGGVIAGLMDVTLGKAAAKKRAPNAAA